MIRSLLAFCATFRSRASPADFFQFCERYGASALCHETFFVSLLAMGLTTVLAILQGQAGCLGLRSLA